MDWFAPIDIYCERTAIGFWNEPVNAISNISFILAGVWALYEMRKQRVSALPIGILVLLSFLVGIGSFLFHTFANAWSEQADVIPIWTLVGLYVLLAVHYFGGVSLGRVGSVAAVVAVLVFAGIWILSGGVTTDTSAAAPATPDPLNGSQQYAPALIALYVFAFVAYRHRIKESGWILGAAAVFTISLVARTFDMALCGIWPLGTHFIWHLLNGMMIALLLQAIIRHVGQSARSVNQPQR